MSHGMWDGATCTICPHENDLNLGDTAPCGCRVRIITKENLIIDAGPYSPNDPTQKREHERLKIDVNYPDGKFVPISPVKPKEASK